MKKIVLLILIFISLIATSCAPKNANSAKVSNTSNDYLYGYSMEELSLGYAIECGSQTRSELIQKENKTALENLYFLSLMNFKASGNLKEMVKLRGNISYICADIPAKNAHAADPVPVMILQGFLKEEIGSGQPYIYAGGQEYQPSELADYIVFEDKIAIVYDMTLLGTDMTIESFFEELEENGEDFTFLIDINKVLKNHLAVM